MRFNEERAKEEGRRPLSPETLGLHSGFLFSGMAFPALALRRRASFLERILGQIEKPDHCFLIWSRNIATAGGNRIGDFSRGCHLAKHDVASFSAIRENLNRRIKLLHPLEEIPKFDRLCYSGALKDVRLDPGHLRVVPLHEPGGFRGSFGLGPPHA